MFGFTAMDVLLGCSGLFFVVIFAHMSLREAPKVHRASCILRYFYFATYVAFLFVSINSILFASHLNIKAIQYEDNLIPKLFFLACLHLSPDGGDSPGLLLGNADAH